MQAPLDDQPSPQVTQHGEEVMSNVFHGVSDQPMTPTMHAMQQKFDEPTFDDQLIDDEDIVPHLSTVKSKPVSHMYGPTALSSPVRHQQELKKIIAKTHPSMIDAPPHQVLNNGNSNHVDGDIDNTNIDKNTNNTVTTDVTNNQENSIPVTQSAHAAPAAPTPPLPSGKVVFFPLHPPSLSVDLKVHLHRVFLTHDLDGDGFIDKDEMIRMFSELQYNYSDDFYNLLYERTLQQMNVRGEDFDLADLYAAGLTETLFLTMYRIFTALHVKVQQKLTTLLFMHCEIDLTRPRKEMLDGQLCEPLNKSGYIMVHEAHFALIKMLTKSVVLTKTGSLDYSDISEELQVVSGKGGLKKVSNNGKNENIGNMTENTENTQNKLITTNNTNTDTTNNTSNTNTNNSILSKTALDKTMLNEEPLLQASPTNGNNTQNTQNAKKHNDLEMYKSFVSQHSDQSTTTFEPAPEVYVPTPAPQPGAPLNSTEAGQFARLLYPLQREEQLFVDNLYDFMVQTLNRVGNFSTVYAPFPIPQSFTAINQIGYLLLNDLPLVFKSLGYVFSASQTDLEEAKASLHEEKVKICQLNNAQELPFTSLSDNLPITKTMFSVLYRRGAAAFCKQRFGEHVTQLLSNHWDVNKDGLISREEFLEGISTMIGANFLDNQNVQAFVEARLHFLQSLDKIYQAEQIRRLQQSQFSAEGTGKNGTTFPRTNVGKQAVLPTATTSLQDPQQYYSQPLPVSRPLTVFTAHDMHTLYDAMDLDENGSVSVTEFLTASKHIIETRVGKDTPLSLQVAVLQLQKLVRAEQPNPVTMMALLEKLPNGYSSRIYTGALLRKNQYTLAAFYTPTLSITGMGQPGFHRNPHTAAMYSLPLSFQNKESATGHITDTSLKAYKEDTLLPLPGALMDLQNTEKQYKKAQSYATSRAHTALHHGTCVATQPQVDSSLWPFLYPSQAIMSEEHPNWDEKGKSVQFSVQQQKTENIPMPNIYFGKHHIVDLKVHVCLMSDLKPVSNILVLPATSKLQNTDMASLLKSHPTHTTSMDWDLLHGDENSLYSYNNVQETEAPRKYSTLGPHNIQVKTRQKTHLFFELIAVVAANEDTPTARSLQGAVVQAAPLSLSVGWGQLDIDSIEETQIKTQRVPLYTGTPDSQSKSQWAAETSTKVQKDAVMVLAVSSITHLSKRQRDLCRYQPVHTLLPVHAVRVARLCRELLADISQSMRKRASGSSVVLLHCVLYTLQHQSVQYEVSNVWETLREHIPSGKREDVSEGVASPVAKTAFAACLLRLYPLIHSCGGSQPVYSASGSIAADAQGTLSASNKATTILPQSTSIHPIQHLLLPPTIDILTIRSALLAGDMFVGSSSDDNKNYKLEKNQSLVPIFEQEEAMHIDSQFLRADAPVIPEETIDGTQAKRGFLLSQVETLKQKHNKNEIYTLIQNVATNVKFHTNSELLPLHTTNLTTLLRTACAVDVKKIEQIHKDVLNPHKSLPAHMHLIHKPFHTDELALSHKSQKALRANILDIAEAQQWTSIPL